MAEADSTHHLVGEGSKNPTIQVSLLEIQNSAHLPEGQAPQWSQCPQRWQAGTQALFESPIAPTSSPVRNYSYINNSKKVLSLRDNLQMGQLMEIFGFHAKEFGLFLKAKGVY